jgi:hypothetical protein
MRIPYFSPINKSDLESMIGKEVVLKFSTFSMKGIKGTIFNHDKNSYEFIYNGTDTGHILSIDLINPEDKNKKLFYIDKNYLWLNDYYFTKSYYSKKATGGISILTEGYDERKEFLDSIKKT